MGDTGSGSRVYLLAALLGAVAGALALCIAACSGEAAPLDEQRAADLAWEALEPNTSSHDRATWDLISVEMVSGREVRELFEGEPVPGRCAPGDEPPDNGRIARGGSYWYVEMKPRAATPLPVPTELFSPTAAPLIPEPVVRGARFLIDADSGRIVARKLHCVIY